MSSLNSPEKHITPFALQLPSQDHAKLLQLAKDRNSTRSTEAEAAITLLAQDYGQEPLPLIDIMDAGGVRRVLVRPTTFEVAQLSGVPSEADPEKTLALGAVFRAAVHRYVTMGVELSCVES